MYKFQSRHQRYLVLLLRSPSTNIQLNYQKATLVQKDFHQEAQIMP